MTNPCKSKRRGTTSLLLCLALLVTSAIGFAQEPDLSQLGLEELMNIKVYSASRHVQSAHEAPSSVTVITADEIQRYGYRTLGDILRSVRGFYVSYDRNYSYLGVRGLSRPGDFNTRILLLIDGHRLNDNVYDQAMIGTEFPLDVDLIERVEIVRGPVSSLYGANGFFGVVNVITRKGRDVSGLEVSSSAGTFGSYQGRISYGRRFSNFEGLLSGGFYGSRGHGRLFYPEFNTPDQNHGVSLHNDDDQLGSMLATVTYRDFTLQTLFGTREKGIPTASWGTIFNQRGSRTSDAHSYVDLQYEHTLSDGWGILARGFYDRYTYQGTYIYPSSSGAGKLNPNLDFADGKWWGGELKVTRTVLRRHSITAGGEYRDNFRQNQSNYDTSPPVIYVQEERSSYVGAIYLQDEFRISKSFLLNAGFRYDSYNQIESSLSPRAALIYRPWQKSAFKLVYGTAFRAPNAYELCYRSFDSLPNPNLGSEKIRTTEVVWEQTLGSNFSFSASGYYNALRNLIGLSLTTDDQFMFENFDRATIKGVEVELDGKTASGWDGGLSYSFQHSRDNSGNQNLINSPQNLVKFKISAPLFGKKLFASVDSQYTSRRRTLANNTLGGFSIFNLTLLGREMGKGVHVSASVYNLFDKKYSDPGSTEHLQDSIQQDGRNFRVTVTWNWGAR